MKTILKIFILFLFLYSLKLNSKDLKLYGSGENKFGHLGLSSTITRYNFELINESDWLKIYTDIGTIFAVKKDSTLWAWGFNSMGEFGNGEFDGFNSEKINYEPVKVSDEYWLDISNMGINTFGIKSDSTLWAWGDNRFGELGTGDFKNHYKPFQIDTNKWIKVYSGSYASFALRSDSTLWAWGNNGNGIIEKGNNEVLSPKMITHYKWIDFSNYSGRVLGIKDDSTLWGWGFASHGVIGLGDNSFIDKPTLISNEKWLKVYTGGTCSFAIKSDSTLWATGRNEGYALGINSETMFYYEFLQVGNDKWKDIEIVNGNLITFGIKVDGTLWATGTDNKGQLGVGKNITYKEFTEIGIDGELNQIITNYYSTYLLIDDSKNYSNEKVIYDFTNVISSNDTITYNYYSDTLHFTYNTNSELILSDKISEFEIEIFYDKFHFFPTIDAFEFSIQNDSIKSKIEKIDGKINKLTIKNLGSSTFTFNDLPIIKGMLLANSDSISYLRTNIYYKNASVSSVKINNLNHKIVSKGRTWVTDHLLSDLNLKIINSVLVDNQLNIVYQTKNVNDALNINIYNNYGLSVEEIVLNEINSEETNYAIDISGLPTGMYIILLSQNGQVKSKSFLKVN